jgi:hypothetical protein
MIGSELVVSHLPGTLEKTQGFLPPPLRLELGGTCIQGSGALCELAPACTFGLQPLDRKRHGMCWQQHTRDRRGEVFDQSSSFGVATD